MTGGRPTLQMVTLRSGGNTTGRSWGRKTLAAYVRRPSRLTRSYFPTILLVVRPAPHGPHGRGATGDASGGTFAVATPAYQSRTFGAAHPDRGTTMGTSTTVERTWRIRFLALAAALAMIVAGLVASSSAVAADEDTTERIGNDPDDRGNLDSWQNFIIVDTNRPADVEGWIREVGFHAAATGTVRFLIINVHEDNDEFTIEAISDEYTVNDTGPHTAPFPTHVEEGHYLGVYTEGTGVVGFEFSGEEAHWNANNEIGNGGPELETGLTFTSVAPEYDNRNRTYSMGATIELPGFGPDDAVVCDDDGCDDATSGNLTASTGATPKERNGLLGLRTLGDSDSDIRNAIYEACDALVADSVRRLGDDVAHIVPVGFAGGEITVKSTILRSVVYGEDDEARGEGIFDVCVAPEKPDYAGYGGEDGLDAIKIEDEDSGFFGPILLENCRGGPFAKDACVESREKEDGNVVLTYRLPTEDPMLR